MDSSPRPKPPICEDPGFQGTEWKVQRLFWLFMYATLLAVMLGAIGKGVLSEKRIASPDDVLQLEYERFLRYRAIDEIRITVNSSHDTARISLSSDYFKHIGIQRILPEPKHIVMTEEAVTMTFDSVSTRPTMVTLAISPDRIGSRQGWISVNGGKRYAFSQFVYP